MPSLEQYLQSLPTLALAHQEKLKAADGVFLVNTLEGASYTLILAGGLLTLVPGSHPAPDCTVIAKESLLLDLLAQKASPAAALMLGKVKVSGKKSLLLNMEFLKIRK